MFSMTRAYRSHAASYYPFPHCIQLSRLTLRLSLTSLALSARLECQCGSVRLIRRRQRRPCRNRCDESNKHNRIPAATRNRRPHPPPGQPRRRLGFSHFNAVSAPGTPLDFALFSAFNLWRQKEPPHPAAGRVLNRGRASSVLPPVSACHQLPVAAALDRRARHRCR